MLRVCRYNRLVNGDGRRRRSGRIRHRRSSGRRRAAPYRRIQSFAQLVEPPGHRCALSCLLCRVSRQAVLKACEQSTDIRHVQTWCLHTLLLLGGACICICSAFRRDRVVQFVCAGGRTLSARRCAAAAGRVRLESVEAGHVGDRRGRTVAQSRWRHPFCQPSAHPLRLHEQQARRRVKRTATLTTGIRRTNNARCPSSPCDRTDRTDRYSQ